MTAVDIDKELCRLIASLLREQDDHNRDKIRLAIFNLLDEYFWEDEDD